MKNFIKNHFRFAIVIIYFTFLILDTSRNFSEKIKSIESEKTNTDHIVDLGIECIINRLDKLEKRLDSTETTISISTELIFDEIQILSAHEYLTYAETIKCFNNYHHNSAYEPIDYVEMSKNIYKCYFDVKREKFNQKLKECNEKKTPMDTH